MRTGLRLTVALIGAGVALGMTGCAPATGSAGPSSTPPTSSSSSSTPSPVATKPTLDQLTISTAGVGNLLIGAPVPAEPASTAPVTFNPIACVSAEQGIAAGDPRAGAWVANYPKSTQSYGPGDPFVLLTTDGTEAGDISVLWVWAPGIHTSTGIEVGSTLAALQRAYPHFDDSASGFASDVYVIEGSNGWLHFEVARQPAGEPYWTNGEPGTVLWMYVTQPLGSAVALAGSDGGPSPCPSGA
jgi:hypothetical protein